MRNHLPVVYTESQLAALLNSPPATTIDGIRDRAVLAVLATSGLRASELCPLLVRDMSPSLLFVRNGKGGKDRFAPLLSGAFLAIQRYLFCHPAIGPDDRLFRTRKGGPLSRRYLHKLVSRYSRPMGLRGPAVHSIRHAAATLWVDRGVSLPRVQAALGHSSILTTALYVRTSTRALVREFAAAYGSGPVAGPASPALA